MRTTKKMARQVNTRVTEELYLNLEKEADRRGLRIPDLVRWILSEWLVWGGIVKMETPLKYGVAAEEGIEYEVR